MSNSIDSAPNQGWRPPIDDADVYGIVRNRLQAFRENSAFPQDTTLTPQEQLALIETLPHIDEHCDGASAADTGMKRLAIFISGAFNSIDLTRTEVTASDWNISREVDAQLLLRLHELEANDGLRKKLGIATLRVIEKFSADANPESSITSLSAELNESGQFLVHRRRLVARLALWESGRSAVVRKVSDFILDTADDTLYNGEEDEIFRLSSVALARGGFVPQFASAYDIHQTTMNKLNERLIRRTHAGIEKGIAAGNQGRATYLRPISVSTHVVVPKPKHQPVPQVPLQRPASAS